MKRVVQDSSQIRSIGFNEGVLEIEFKKGGIYQYSPVSEKLYHQFIESESLGSFFYQNIKTRIGITTTKIE